MASFYTVGIVGYNGVLGEMQMSIRVKLLRWQRSWSLGELGERTGLTKSYLSKVERGVSVPSIAVAIKLARALEVDVEALFSDETSAAEIKITRAAERTGFDGADVELGSVQSISGAAAKRMMPFVMLPPPEFAPASREHEGEELLFVHKGTIEIAFPNQTVKLRAGDSVYFNALIPHRVRTVSTAQAEVLIVVSYADD